MPFDHITFFEHPSGAEWWLLLAVIVGHMLGAFCTGCVGVGGVVFVPLLLLLPNVPLGVAVGSVFFAMLCGNLVLSLRWRLAPRLPAVGSPPSGRVSIELAALGFPMAFAGSLLIPIAPKAVLGVAVASICLLYGLNLGRKTWADLRDGARSRPAPDADFWPVELPPSAAGEEEGDERWALNPLDLVFVQRDVAAACAGGCADSEGSTQTVSLEFSEGISITGADVDADPGLVRTSLDVRSPGSGCDYQSVAAEEAGEGGQVEAEGVRVPVEAGKADFFSTAGRAASVKRVLVGGFTALVSAMTGTGGAVVLFPVVSCLFPGTDFCRLIGESRLMSFAICFAAALGTVLFGAVDFGLALLMIANVCIVSFIGASVADHIPTHRLKLLLAVVLVASGVASLTQIVIRLV
ncbi:hypothetical protein DIPPA_18563 [Diplonema papillatum]|nr:hypothetical protein DIPPA_18563 [Diplonema papillatum]